MPSLPLAHYNQCGVTPQSTSQEVREARDGQPTLFWVSGQRDSVVLMLDVSLVDIVSPPGNLEMCPACFSAPGRGSVLTWFLPKTKMPASQVWGLDTWSWVGYRPSPALSPPRGTWEQVRSPVWAAPSKLHRQRRQDRRLKHRPQSRGREQSPGGWGGERASDGVREQHHRRGWKDRWAGDGGGGRARDREEGAWPCPGAGQVCRKG